MTNSANNRHEILHNIDEKSGYAALRVGQFKYVDGKFSSILNYMFEKAIGLKVQELLNPFALFSH